MLETTQTSIVVPKREESQLTRTLWSRTRYIYILNFINRKISKKYCITLGSSRYSHRARSLDAVRQIKIIKSWKCRHNHVCVHLGVSILKVSWHSTGSSAFARRWTRCGSVLLHLNACKYVFTLMLKVSEGTHSIHNEDIQSRGQRTVSNNTMTWQIKVLLLFYFIERNLSYWWVFTVYYISERTVSCGFDKLNMLDTGSNLYLRRYGRT